jgi:RNA polymerase sigma-70 factor, ECF subfamily
VARRGRRAGLRAGHRPDSAGVTPGPARFDELWALRHRIAAFVRGQAVDRETRDEVLSEIFLVAWRRLAEVPEGDDAATAWLCGVARHTVRNQRRNRRRQDAVVERLAGHLVVERRPEPDPAVVDEQRKLVEEVWESLPPADRDVLALALMGAGLNELADELGVSRGAAAVRLSRARRRLENAMTE